MPLDHLLGSVFKFSTIGRIPGVGPGSNKMEMCSPYSFQKLILYHSSFPPILSTILKKISKSVLSLCGIRKWKWKWKSLIHGWLFATPWTVACQASLAMEFSRQESLSGLPFISPGIFLTQRLNSGLLHCRQVLYRLSHQGSPFVVSDQWAKLDTEVGIPLNLALPAGVQPQLIQGIRRRDGVGEDQETTA